MHDLKDTLKRAGNRFLQELLQANTTALEELLSDSFRAEGFLQGEWQCWDKATYLQRVAVQIPMMKEQSPTAKIEKAHLSADMGFVESQLSWDAGCFYDRLLWVRQGEKWQLQHKIFEFRDVG